MLEIAVKSENKWTMSWFETRTTTIIGRQKQFT